MIAVIEVNLTRVSRALEGEVKGAVASRLGCKGGCGVKVDKLKKEKKRALCLIK